jgi:hypothetical protein
MISPKAILHGCEGDRRSAGARVYGRTDEVALSGRAREPLDENMASGGYVGVTPGFA